MDFLAGGDCFAEAKNTATGILSRQRERWQRTR
jgi:hypothetical protein